MKPSSTVARLVAGSLAALALGSTGAAVAAPADTATGPATRLQVSSPLGFGFDVDEYDLGEIAVDAVDASGQRVDTDGQVLTYQWTITPFPSSPGGAVTVPAVQQPVDDAGRFVVDLPAERPSGFYSLTASLSAGGGGGAIATRPINSWSVGQARVVTTTDPATGDVGQVARPAGRLVLENGTLLVGREVRFAYVADKQYDAFGFAGAGDAQLVFNQSARTDSRGGFYATVVDQLPAGTLAPSGAEYGHLDVTGPADGWARTGPAPSAIGVRFVKTEATPGTQLTVSYDDGGTQPVADSVLPATVTAISPAIGPGARKPAPGLRVQLTLDHGSFVDPAAPAGATPDQLGQSITAVTGEDGTVKVATTVSQAAPFDADGHLEVHITVSAPKAAGQSDSVVWTGPAAPAPPAPPTDGTSRVSPELHALARDAGRRDVVRAQASTAAAGARAVVYRIVGDRRVRVASGVLDARGDLRVTVADRNGLARTAYRVVVARTERTTAATSPRVRVR